MKLPPKNKRRLAANAIALTLSLVIVVCAVFYLHKTDKLTELFDTIFFGAKNSEFKIVRLYPATECEYSDTISMPDESKMGGLLKCREYSFESLTENPVVKLNQSLLLVNTSNKIPDDFPADIVEYNDTDVLMNSCITQAYATLSAAVREKFGTKLYVSSSYRSAAEQAAVIIEVGPETATEVGASEHQTGLALDVYVAGFSGDRLINCDAGKFINQNCHDYGFIIRYPAHKTDITGIRYEPWHIRYVGQPHAKIISEKGLALEEYVLSYEPGVFYAVGDYVVSKQPASDKIKVPEGAKSVTISEDNMGNVFVNAYFGN